MREIKFRAWDKEKKEWIENTGTTFTSENPKEGVVALSLGGHLRVFSASLMRGEKEEDNLIGVGHSEYESVHPCHTEPHYKRQYILCQFTGLRDKNGKEIYEGDVVKHEWATNRFENRVVEWNNEISVDENSFRCAVGYDAWVQDQYDNEIIGNIYENPELLNK